ncbi:DUF998 domain-containing protein [Microtetraspora sp. NBRC 16547]|uniref:DUF998 domain-containing protein n=1 Tax=Microtetraspora sp. NBRC 16547 TaxID=3030993 RepID=UPI0024A34481|nr:DUF998 domain-containing protein [Microtetraspora sp. NBRC 16547]GLX00425.1 hypothetical protein Misp02_45110 [Microtetraspora sp. NBRC 16547]
MRAPKISGTTSAYLLCGAIGGPLFVVAFLLEGATRADYDPLRHPVSSLALGPYGWMQIANFVVVGLLMLLFAVGLRRGLHAVGRRSTWGPLLVGTYAIALVGAGIFVTDPVGGYPRGTPAQSVHTWHGMLHNFPFSLLVFAALAGACFVFARRFAGWGDRGWALYSAATGTLVVIGFFLSGQAFSQAEGLVEIGGLLQRLTIAVGWAWLALLAVHVRGEGQSAGEPR